jgi:hypothetical protein
MTDQNYLNNYYMKTIAAIEHLSSNGFHEASLMLTYAGIDQMAWLSVGSVESNGNDFKAWVEKYLQPSKTLGCSADDLWAARCGVLHTEAAESRDTDKLKAKKIYYTLGDAVCTENKTTDVVIINATTLIKIFFTGAYNFITAVKADPKVIEKAGAILAFSKNL